MKTMIGHMIKTIKVIYRGRKSARLYCDVLIHDVDKPKCCEKWKTELNEFISWNTNFKKNPGNKT